MDNSQTTPFRDRVHDLGYSAVYALIQEWVIGKDAERDREIMRYWLLDGLTHNQIARRYQDAHPDMPICEDTVKRIISRRKQRLFKHFPGE